MALRRLSIHKKFITSFYLLIAMTYFVLISKAAFIKEQILNFVCTFFHNDLFLLKQGYFKEKTGYLQEISTVNSFSFK